MKIKLTICEHGDLCRLTGMYPLPPYCPYWLKTLRVTLLCVPLSQNMWKPFNAKDDGSIILLILVVELSSPTFWAYPATFISQSLSIAFLAHLEYLIGALLLTPNNQDQLSVCTCMPISSVHSRGHSWYSYYVLIHLLNINKTGYQ